MLRHISTTCPHLRAHGQWLPSACWDTPVPITGTLVLILLLQSQKQPTSIQKLTNNASARRKLAGCCDNSMQVFLAMSKKTVSQLISVLQFTVSEYLLGVEATNRFISILLALKNNKSKAWRTVGLPHFYKTSIFLKSFPQIRLSAVNRYVTDVDTGTFFVSAGTTAAAAATSGTAASMSAATTTTTAASTAWRIVLFSHVCSKQKYYKQITNAVSYTHLTLPTNREV